MVKMVNLISWDFYLKTNPPTTQSYGYLTLWSYCRTALHSPILKHHDVNGHDTGYSGILTELKGIQNLYAELKRN